MTASFNASFAASKPAISSHFTFGFSDKMALARFDFNFFVSASSSSSVSEFSPSPSSAPFLGFDELAPPPPLAETAFFVFFGFDKNSFSFSARSRYSVNFLRIESFTRSFFSSGVIMPEQVRKSM
ncbi:hypothetical protein BKA69DRAFT_41411 [Paraphysoderma sedebokerense]|nr:hypothetical protein BKA69DRAFT_41411 [Paraphysoderma sedebokerense]